jgi:Protein involved in formate dehydrogenase formation
MRDSWQRRIDRAADLAERDRTARPLLLAYGRLLGIQRDCHEMLRQRADRLTGSLDRDLPEVRPGITPMLSAVAAIGPPPLADEARRLLDGGAAAIDAMLLDGWHAPSGERFFPKIALQPYAECLAAIDVRPLDRDRPRGKYVCPFCGGAPQLSILTSGGDAGGGGRQLLCGTCFTVWPFRRVLCAQCGEEDERRLGYFRSPAFDHLRVDACDTCRHYLKTVDLSRLGIAVPVVDEVAGAPLDLWALEHEYRKIELNLVGL